LLLMAVIRRYGMTAENHFSIDFFTAPFSSAAVRYVELLS